MAVREEVEYLISFLTRVQGSEQATKLLADIRNFDMAQEKQTTQHKERLKSLQNVMDDVHKKWASYIGLYNQGKVSTEQLHKVELQYWNARKAHEEFGLQILKQRVALLKQQEAILSKLGTAQAKLGVTGGITPEEQAMAANFRRYMPTIRRDLAAAEAEGAGQAPGQQKTGYGHYFQTVGAMYVGREAIQFIQDATQETLEYADAIRLLSQQTGMATETSSVYVLSAQELGVKTDTVNEAFRTFSDRLYRSIDPTVRQTQGSRDFAKALDDLGVSIKNDDGTLRSMDEIMYDIYGRFGDLGSGVEATQKATALFGQRADELLPQLLAGSKGLDIAKQKAIDFNLIIGKDSVEAIKNTSIALKDFEMSWTGIKVAIIEGISPIMEFAVPALQFISAEIQAWFKRAQATVITGRFIIENMTTMSARELFQKTGRVYEEALAQLEYKGSEFERLKFWAIDQAVGIFKPGYQSEGSKIEEDAIKRRNALMTSKLPYRPPVIGAEGDFYPEKGAAGAEESRDDFKKQADRFFQDYEAYRNKLDDIESKYNEKISDMRNDFNREERQRSEKFYLDREQDKALHDLRVVETERELKNKLEDMEESWQEKRTKLIEKWDDILLKLQVGGDTESIKQAIEARDKDIALKEKEHAEDVRKVKEEAAIESRVERDTFEMKRRFELQDFEISRRAREEDLRMKIEIAGREYNETRNAVIREFTEQYNLTWGWQTSITGAYQAWSNERKRIVTDEVNFIISEYERANRAISPILSGAGSPFSNPRAPQAYDYGGVVPGPMGAPHLAIVHGGERFTPPAHPAYYQSIRNNSLSIHSPVSVSANVNTEAMANRVLARASRELGRGVSRRM